MNLSETFFTFILTVKKGLRYYPEHARSVPFISNIVHFLSVGIGMLYTVVCLFDCFYELWKIMWMLVLLLKVKMIYRTFFLRVFFLHICIDRTKGIIVYNIKLFTKKKNFTHNPSYNSSSTMFYIINHLNLSVLYMLPYLIMWHDLFLQITGLHLW